VGLLQREIENQGIATVGISIAREITEKVKPPRTYYLRYPFGHALGERHQKAQQFAIFTACLDLLASSTQPGAIVDSPYRWRRDKF
jgi:hypothetical protein